VSPTTPQCYAKPFAPINRALVALRREGQPVAVSTQTAALPPADNSTTVAMQKEGGLLWFLFE
jgi:hypothetical protein